MNIKLKERIYSVPSALFLSAMLAFFTVSAGCGDEEGGGSDSFGDFYQAQISVSPAVLTFDANAVGMESVQFLTIVNVGQGALIIEELELDTRSNEFSISSVSLPMEIEPNDQRIVEVYYTPADCDDDEGNLIIHSNDGDNRELAVPLQPQPLTGQVRVFPNPIDFGRVPSGTQTTVAVSITNAGTCVLEVNDLFITGSADFAFTAPGEEEGSAPVEVDPDLPFILETNDSTSFDITYTPVNDGFDEATLIVRSDDEADQSVEVPIVANGDQACITVSEEDGIDYGERYIGEVHPKTITVTNCSQNEDLLVSSIELSEHWELLGLEQYSLAEMPAMSLEEPLTIEPEGSESFILNFDPILYTPDNHPDCDNPEGCEISDGALMVILSNDEVKSPLEIEIRGIGTNNHCPVAEALARVQGSDAPWDVQLDTIPLATIEFDGSSSYDAEGLIASYQWEVSERPEGSTALYQPNANVSNPTFFLDLAGQYVFTLRVFDQSGVESCDSSEILAIVTPNEDIHVQLVWETIADPDETDGSGADVDLHLLNTRYPGAVWDSAPGDCFWRARSPDWGVLGDTEDDPSLDIDDTDGAGPENINLNNPEGSTADPFVYDVGVYYFSDHGFGPTDATIRIYLDGLEQFSLTFPGLEDRQFWDVATIEWPTRLIERIHRLYPSGFP